MNRFCVRCETDKPAGEFHTTKNNWCRPCTAVYNKAYHAKHNERLVRENANRHLKRVYGITIEEYESMLDDRDGKCDICGRTDSRHRSGKMQVDHCHESGEIRGILCFPCNSSLGGFGDDIETLRKALKYMESYCE